MRIGDLIRAAGGFTQDAYTLQAEMIRFEDNEKTSRNSFLIPINLSQLDDSNNITLQAFDQIDVKRIPEWTERETIEISGEVRFPRNLYYRAW